MVWGGGSVCWCIQRVGKVARAAGVARRRRRVAVILGSNMVGGGTRAGKGVAGHGGTGSQESPQLL